MVHSLSPQKRMASEVLGVGVNKIRFDPEKLAEIKEAITRADVRALILKGFISAKPAINQSRGRARENQEQKQRGRRRGIGKRKGRKNARTSPKEKWMARIRSQRTLLKQLKENGVLDSGTYRKYYLRAKGGLFRSREHLKLTLRKEVGDKE